MFLILIIRIIIISLFCSLMTRDSEAVFITDSIKMTRAQCVGSVTFLDESQEPRVTFNRSIRKVRRLGAREVMVEGCGCFVLYKLPHYRGASQEVGPGLSEVTLWRVRSLQRLTECEGRPYSTTIMRKKYQFIKIETSTQPSETSTVATVPTTTASPAATTAPLTARRPTPSEDFIFAEELKKSFINVRTKTLKDNSTETWNKTYQTSPTSIITSLQTSEKSTLKLESMTPSNELNQASSEDKIRALSFAPKKVENIEEVNKDMINNTTIKSVTINTAELIDLQETTAGSEVYTDKSVKELYTNYGSRQLNLNLNAILTYSSNGTDGTHKISQVATYPLTAEKNTINYIKRQSMEPKMSSLESILTNSALSLHSFVCIIIVQIGLNNCQLFFPLLD